MVQFPSIEWIQQNPAINPSGSRHLHSTVAGFIRTVDTGAGGVLDFGQLNTTGSGATSPTLLCYARISNIADASGVFNMRFFLVNTSAWGAGSYRFLEQKQFHFIPNLTLDSAALNTPVVIPNKPNFSGTIQSEWPLGQPWMSGVRDNDVSQYVYLAVEVGVNVPFGTYGGAGAGTFRYRLLYDFS